MKLEEKDKLENSIDELYEKILNLEDTDHRYFQTFYYQNMWLLTRCSEELLLKRIYDKKHSQEQLNNFDLFKTYELIQTISIQNSNLSNVVNRISLSDSIKILDYFSEQREKYQMKDKSQSWQALTTANYHIAMNFMQHMSDLNSKKRIDFHLQQEEVSNYVAERMINAISEKLIHLKPQRSINYSYDEQIQIVAFLYQNKINLKELKEHSFNSKNIISTSTETKDFIDMFIDQDLLYIQKQIAYKEDKQFIETQINNMAEKLIVFGNNFLHEEKEMEFTLTNTIANKIRKINNTLTPHNSDNQHYIKMLEQINKPLLERLETLHIVSDLIKNKINELNFENNINKIMENNNKQIKRKPN